MITSNFEKLRFYISNAVDFEEFDLFNITLDRFELLYLCLYEKNILNNLPLKIKEASIVQEEVITKKIYADYSLFKRELYQDLTEKNLNLPLFQGNEENEIKLLLFKKSQKLLDRFLFIFFAEDKGLLPPNSIPEIIQQWEQLKDLDEYKPLYDRYKKYFTYLNEGWKGKKYEIFGYNGGLFFPDKILDAISIDDELLKRHTNLLSSYDFNTDVDVNILGHIFENSLNEIEEITAQLEGQEVDLKKSKRKKDGVYYTPKYITKYIVDNTVGKLCEEKKEQLGIIEDDYYKGRKSRHKTTIRELDKKLQQYRDWLLEITICDPACGSGAFLNQALDFLIKEHHYIDELQAKLLEHPFVFPDIENTILEKNLYGVDINEESVDIARLSLWLRTAQKGRKLTTLSNNIKCGNSLIDDPEIAGEKAFNWQKEFPNVFKQGASPDETSVKSGFDVVIGNPPYLRVQGLRENFEKESIFYETKYNSATGRFDIYVLFIEKSFLLINKSGYISFILPHKFMVSDFGEGIRKFLTENKAINSVLHFGSEMVFSDASTYTCIIELSHNNTYINYKQLNPSDILFDIQFEEVDYKTLDSNKWKLHGVGASNLFEKINKQPLTIKSVFENISQGVVSVGDDIFFLKGEIQGDKFVGFSDKIGEYITIEAEIVKPLLKGEDVKKYVSLKNTFYCLYPHYEKDGRTVPFEEDYFKEKYPLAYNYIFPYKGELIEKKIRYKTNPKAWYSLHRSREMSLFEQEKIITPEISLGTNMTIDSDNFYHNTKCYTLAKKNDIVEDNRFWIAILNSKLLWYFLSSTGYVLRGGFFTFKTKYLEPFPLPKLEKIEQQKPFVEKVEFIMKQTASLQYIQGQFTELLNSKFKMEKISKKLYSWYELDFKEFLKELKKTKVQLSLSEEAEWMQYFNEQKQKAQELKAEIDTTDKKIDQMVYELYGLTEEEIIIVEESIK